MRIYGFLQFCSVALAVTVHGTVQVSDILRDPVYLSSASRVNLQDIHSMHSVPITQSGTFTFFDITPGSYVLDVTSTSHSFRPLRIDVLKDSETNVLEATAQSESDMTAGQDDVQDASRESVRVYKITRGTVWTQPEARQPYPIVLRAVGVIDYYTPRPSFNILALLKNPMVLLGLFMAIAVFGLPALTKLLDPEGVEEMERIRAEKAEKARSAPAVDNPVEKIQNFDISGWLAGKK